MKVSIFYKVYFLKIEAMKGKGVYCHSDPYFDFTFNKLGYFTPYLCDAQCKPTYYLFQCKALTHDQFFVSFNLVDTV